LNHALFTGTNPLKPILANDFVADVELDPLGPVPGELGEPIRLLIQRMLSLDRDTRPPASDLLGDWHEFFLEAAKRTNALNGQVF
jgi:hypothetical protein